MFDPAQLSMCLGESKVAVVDLFNSGVKSMSKDCIVIGIAGVSGAGKSTVIDKLTELLDDASVISFDSYTPFEAFPMLDDTLATYFGLPPTETPRDYQAWFKRGADFNEIESPQLAEHLQALRLGKSVTSPLDGVTVAPAKYIIFEAPLGRVQQKTSRHIDFLVFIDTPLEVSLARMVMRDIGNIAMDQMSREEAIGQLKSVKMLIESYFTVRRPFSQALIEQVKPTSDLIVDGEQSSEDLAKVIVDRIARARMK